MIAKVLMTSWGRLVLLATLTASREPSTAGNRLSNTHAADVLQVNLRIGRTSYKVGNTIHIVVTIENMSRDALFIYRAFQWGEGASVGIWLRDAVTGRPINQPFIADEQTPPPTSKAAFVEVLPQHVYGRSWDVPLVELGVRSAGTYEIFAQYHSPIPADEAFGLPIWPREKGPLSSEVATLTVVP
jgi:hypothetical protein